MLLVECSIYSKNTEYGGLLMAGYIFTLDSIEALNRIIEDGIYSTRLKIPEKNIWTRP